MTEAADYGAERSPSAEYLAAIEHLGEPSIPERLLMDEVVKVDLESRSGTKWNPVAERLKVLLDAEESELDFGGGGMTDPSKFNQTTNRMRQKGVGGSDVTIFVVGEVACLDPMERALKEVIADPSYRLREALLVLRDWPRDHARIVKILRQEGV